MNDAEHDTLRDTGGLYLVGALAAADRERFEHHLALCEVCAEEVRALSEGLLSLARTLPSVVPPDRVRARVLRALAGHADANGSAPLVVPFALRGKDTNNMVSMTDSTSSKGRAFWAGWITAAAALLVAAGAGIYAANMKLQLDDVELRLVDAVMKLQSSEQQVVAATAQANAVRTNLTLVAAPDVIDLKLTGKAPAADAAGRAFISKSRGLLFAASKLPTIPADKTYQLWVLTKGAPVSAGIVRPDEQGNITAAFDAPDVPAPTGFAVSLEPDGGVSAPTGAIYLSTP